MLEAEHPHKFRFWRTGFLGPPRSCTRALGEELGMNQIRDSSDSPMFNRSPQGTLSPYISQFKRVGYSSNGSHRIGEVDRQQGHGDILQISTESRWSTSAFDHTHP